MKLPTGALVVLLVAQSASAQPITDIDAARLRIDFLRLQMAQTRAERLEYRATQSRPTRRIRAGSPFMALGVLAAGGSLTLLVLRENPRPILPELTMVASAGVALITVGLALLIRGLRMRRRSEQAFRTRHDELERERSQLELQWWGDDPRQRAIRRALYP